MTSTLNLTGLTTAQIQRLQALAEQFRITNQKNLETNPSIHNGQELLAYWQQTGVINSLPKTIDSAQYARQLRQQAQSRNFAQF